MKYLKKFNESSKALTKEEIESYFLSTFDLANSYKIDNDIYFDSKSREWANNDFSNDGMISNDEPTICVEGFSIEIEHEFCTSTFGNTEVDKLEKYSKLITQLSEDLDRFIKLNKPSDVFFTDNSPITILIKP